MRNPIYSVYSMIMLAAFGYFSWRAPAMGNVTPVKDVPRSVRENPGVYRSHYAYLPQFFHGK